LCFAAEFFAGHYFAKGDMFSEEFFGWSHFEQGVVLRQQNFIDKHITLLIEIMTSQKNLSAKRNKYPGQK